VPSLSVSLFPLLFPEGPFPTLLFSRVFSKIYFLSVDLFFLRVFSLLKGFLCSLSPLIPLTLSCYFLYPPVKKHIFKCFYRGAPLSFFTNEHKIFFSWNWVRMRALFCPPPLFFLRSWGHFLPSADRISSPLCTVSTNCVCDPPSFCICSNIPSASSAHLSNEPKIIPPLPSSRSISLSNMFLKDVHISVFLFRSPFPLKGFFLGSPFKPSPPCVCPQEMIV